MIGATLRFAILRRDGFACRYCGRCPPIVVLVVDHIIPIAANGTDEDSNLVTACEDCNAGKGSLLLAPGERPTAARPMLPAEFEERDNQLTEAILAARMDADLGLDHATIRSAVASLPPSELYRALKEATDALASLTPLFGLVFSAALRARMGRRPTDG